MTRKSSTIPPEYFEDKYKANIDPWQFRSSAYECAKYEATLRALSKEHYTSALEVGCSIGVLTQFLRLRCNNLLALDASETAIEAAKSVNDESVTFLVANLPAEFPKGSFELIMLSEVLYYFSAQDLEHVAQMCGASLLQDGEIVLCHWLGETDYPLSGADASEIFARAIKPRLPTRSIVHDEIYRLERFSSR